MGCKPRSALEESDSSALRLEKIYKLIKNCRFSIHDLSRTELSHSTGLPRFNMPLETPPRGEVAHPEFTEANLYSGCWSTALP